MKCPYCSEELSHITFYKFFCPKCEIHWAITKITETNRKYYK